MMDEISPYARVAANLRENEFSVMPVGPGTKIPGRFSGGAWSPMPGWQKYCDNMAPEFVHDGWEKWIGAGVCIAHGKVIGLDLDTDRDDIAAAIHGAIEPPNARRRGSKGWMGYYRAGDGLGDLTARVRWYDPKSDSPAPVVELLLHGTQSVLPPTIHPDTGKPYTWLTPDSLESLDASELPEFTGKEFDALDAAFIAMGLTRQAPRKARLAEYDMPDPSASDLEKPFGRSLNDRAMEASAMDQWWPALDLPKSRQRGHGAWEGVPFWRGSNSGRAPQDRNPNLKSTPRGIVDFGADRSYTPIDVVMAARGCDFGSAAEWLRDYVREEDGCDAAPDIVAPTASSEAGGDVHPATCDPAPSLISEMEDWAAPPVIAGKRMFGAITPVREPSDAAWEALMPKEPPAFPVQSFASCEGLLGEVAQHIDNASVTATEAGALAVTLPILGSVFGQAYATTTNLRTNVYTVALGGSGTGKTSLVSPAKELLLEASLADIIGGDRFASGSGLLQMLRQGSRRVCFLDEFGHMLQQISSPGAGVHARQIITEFTALFSAAGTVFSGTAYADGRENSIANPHLCLFGMATPDQFWRAFGSSALEDGSIARYLVFPLGQTGAKKPDKSAAGATAEALRYVQGLRRKTGNLGGTDVVTVPMSDSAEKARVALKNTEASFALYAENNGIRGAPGVLKRVTENALKIALISAAGRKPDNPEIDGSDFAIGHALAWWSANVMVSNITSHIADNQMERDVNEIERKIMAAGEEGILRGTLRDRCRGIGKRSFDEILDALEEAGAIRKERMTGANNRAAWRVYSC